MMDINKLREDLKQHVRSKDCNYIDIATNELDWKFFYRFLDMGENVTVAEYKSILKIIGTKRSDYE